MNFSLSCFISILTEPEPFSLAKTASSIASSEFEYRTTTSVVWQRADSDQVTNFLSIYQGSVQTIHKSENQKRSINIQQAVLFVTSSYEFLQLVANLDKNVSCPSKVITVVTHHIPDLTNITKVAWKYFVTDLIILIPHWNKPAMYTYYPYSDKKCGNTRPIKVNIKNNFFPSKFNNLLGCEIRLGTWGFSIRPYYKVECVNGSSPFIKGLVGDLFMIIAEHINSKIKVVCADQNTKDPIFYDLNEKNIHLLTPTLMVDWHSSVYQNTGIYLLLEMVWCGPPRREIYTRIKVIVPFMNKTMVLVCIVFVMLIALLKIINKIEPISKKSCHLAWYTLAIILGQSAGVKSKSRLINFLFVLWIWFSMVVTIAYNGLLVKGLRTKILEPRFDIIENAVNLVDGYGGVAWLRDWYKDSPIWDRYESITIRQEHRTLPRLARGKRYLILSQRLTLLGYRLQVLERTAGLQPVTALMPARWGAAARIRKAQTRLIEGGFIDKSIRDEELAVAKQEAMLTSDSSESEAGQLDLEKLISCFFGLGIMWVVCCIIFLLEIVYHRLKTPTVQDKFPALQFDKVPKSKKFSPHNRYMNTRY